MRKNSAMSPTKTPLPEGPGFIVRSPCGREWFVSLGAVGKDYAEFLMEADGIAPSDAIATAERERGFWPTWFVEQCLHWGDIEQLGVLTKASRLFKTKAALDRRRGRYAEEYHYVEMAPAINAPALGD